MCIVGNVKAVFCPLCQYIPKNFYDTQFLTTFSFDTGPPSFLGKLRFFTLHKEPLWLGNGCSITSMKHIKIYRLLFLKMLLKRVERATFCMISELLHDTFCIFDRITKSMPNILIIIIYISHYDFTFTYFEPHWWPSYDGCETISER